MSFTHLHVHSHYSLLDGLTKIPDLVKAAKKRGFSAVALTDHGVLYGAIEFYKACKKEGINPIIGCEIYVAPTSRFEKDSKNRYHHLVLLAENYEGYKNLMKLSSFGFTEGFYYKPRVDKELLRKYSKGLIASSACFSGEIPKILRKEDNFEKAKEVALEYQDIFGSGNFFLEMIDLPALEGQMDLNDKLIELSKATGIPLIVTRDSHYLNPEDAEAQDILTCIRDGRVLDEPNRPSMQGIDFSLATEKEIASRFKHIPEAIHNTGKIADRVNLELELDKWHFPAIVLPKGKTADVVLQEEVYKNIPNFMELTPEIKKRADYELDIIKTKGYSPYFLAVAEYVNFAKDNGIVETTRGSGAGSLVSYSLGITTVDPIYFKLPFERFLNPFRPSPPDIDTDFADDRRHEVVEHMTDLYGADKVANIITFGTMQARGAIRDVGRALGFSYSFCDQVSKLIPFGAQGFNMNIAKAMELEPDFKKMYKENPDVKRLVDLAMKVEGCARHTSMHAAGVVISPTPLTDFMPVQVDQDKNKIVTQYEFHSSEAAGVLKMDFLGIRNLSILGHAMDIVEKTLGDKIDIYNLPLDDKKTYEMLARGETVGVFQLSGSGMTKWLKEMKPNRIHDIMAIVALFRPGPMESIPEYIRRKYNPELVKYPDPRLKDILEASYGLLVYQDDVMLTAIELAGYDWFEADKFRKAMGKKIPEEMAKQKIKFYEGCKTYGKLDKKVIDELWTAIEPFAAYGFNKAHAASYGIVAYQTAYMKANYPIHYMTAVLIAESGDMDKVPAIIHECGKMDIEVLPPDVNHSFKSFAMIEPEDGGKTHIRFGLSGIKNVGDNISEAIYRERKENGKFKNLEEFLSRVKDKDLNKRAVDSLAKCGAMDCFGIDRGVLIANIENILAFVKHLAMQRNTNQSSLFTNTNIDIGSKVTLESAEKASEDEKLIWEKELLGLYVSSHPFRKFQKELENILVPLNELASEEKGQWVVVGGMLDKATKKITRKGSAMMFAVLQDLTDNLELLVFPKTYETTKDIWVENTAVVVIGKTSEEEGDDKLFVEKAYTVTSETVGLLKAQLSMGQTIDRTKKTSQVREVSGNLPVPRLELVLNSSENKEKIQKIKDLLSQITGDTPVFIKAGDKVIKTSYKINPDKQVFDDLAQLAGEENLVLVR